MQVWYCKECGCTTETEPDESNGFLDWPNWCPNCLKTYSYVPVEREIIKCLKKIEGMLEKKEEGGG